MKTAHRTRRVALFTFVAAALGVAITTGGAAMAQDDTTAQSVDLESPENILVFELSTGGAVKIAMRPDKAPKHVERLKTLARRGFYDNTVFHRVIDGFMAQGGDPTGTGMGGSDLPDLPAEFNDLQHLRGTASMARTNDPNSANSQFFICFDAAFFLDGQYTVWGEVVEGMEHVDALPKGEPPREPGKIISMRTV